MSAWTALLRKMESQPSPSKRTKHNKPGSVVPALDVIPLVTSFLRVIEHVVLLAVSRATQHEFRLAFALADTLVVPNNMPRHMVVTACTSRCPQRGVSGVRTLRISGASPSPTQVEALTRRSWLTHLDLPLLRFSDNNTRKRFLESLVQGLPDSSLKFVRLSGNNLNWVEAQALAGVLPRTKIQVLVLDQNKIRSSGAKVLAKSLPDTDLRCLSLNNNGIRDGGVLALATVLPASKLRCLCLNGSVVSDKSVLRLVNTISSTLLQKLSLYCYHYGNIVVRGLADAFPSSSLLNLSLYSSVVTANVVKLFAKNLSQSRIRTLRLTFPHMFEDEWGRDIITYLMSVPSLTDLDLTYNQIADLGCRALADSLHKSRLRRLCMILCHITDTGASALALALPKSCLQVLTMTKNHTAELGAQALRRVIPHTRMTRLALRPQGIQTQLAENIRNVLGERCQVFV